MTKRWLPVKRQRMFKIKAVDIILPSYLIIEALPTLWYGRDADAGAAAPYQMAGVALFICGMTVLHWQKFSAALMQYLTKPVPLLFTIAMCLAVLRAAFTASITELAYVLVTTLTVLGMSALWRQPKADIERQCFLTTVALCGYVAALFALGPIDLARRAVGTIHPNLLGASAFAIVVFVWISNSRWRWGVLPAMIGVTLAVSSRNALLSILLFQGVFAAGALWRRTSLIPALTVCLLVMGAAVIFHDQIEAGVVTAMALDDPLRGVDSGGSGRTELWQHFAPQFLEHPLLGYGFRQRDLYDTAHNAVLNLLLENGVFVGALLLTFILAALWRASRIDIVVASALGAFLLRSLIEPQMLNVGDVPGAAFLFVLGGAAVMASNGRVHGRV